MQFNEQISESSIHDDIWSKFADRYSVISLLLAVGLSFVFWFLTPTETILVKYAFIIFSLLTIAAVTFFSISIFYKRQITKLIHSHNLLLSESIPTVIRSIRYKDHLLILAKFSKLFAIGMPVSIYYKDDFEILIVCGMVINIQSDGLIQIKLEITCHDDELYRKIHNNDKDVISKLLVRPFIPTYIEAAQ